MSRTASVKISRPGHKWSVVVDGREIVDQIMAGSLTVTDFDPDTGEARVSFTLIADVEIDVQSAEVVA